MIGVSRMRLLTALLIGAGRHQEIHDLTSLNGSPTDSRTRSTFRWEPPYSVTALAEQTRLADD